MLDEIAKLDDEPDVLVTVSREKTPKTWPQIKVFHGPIVEQVQAFIQETEGVYKSADRVKEMLKNMFLEKEKVYWNDGSPKMVTIPHPERKKVSMEWHEERLPSLADLSIEQMRAFIEAILEYYFHECGLIIKIDPEK
jgi:hypothetical protein